MTCVISRPNADPERRSHELPKAAPREDSPEIRTALDASGLVFAITLFFLPNPVGPRRHREP